ncbi:hypothetical protein GUJ93_ZPchr0002g24407 [Zizania palustris]|uniref:Uncharacterized protein n=1 Tax=Zizania palustris TaxID=103762 RepID=A0A8J5RJP5_ZIZPA|nr:hypothetical protein GUJ93_ZPchr0002g24407 [Zizania palustris]
MDFVQSQDPETYSGGSGSPSDDMAAENAQLRAEPMRWWQATVNKLPTQSRLARPLAPSEVNTGLRRRRTGFEPGEPGSSGRLDARGAGSSVTVAAKVVRVGPRVETRQVKAESAERGSG